MIMNDTIKLEVSVDLSYSHVLSDSRSNSSVFISALSNYLKPQNLDCNKNQINILHYKHLCRFFSRLSEYNTHMFICTFKELLMSVIIPSVCEAIPVIT